MQRRALAVVRYSLRSTHKHKTFIQLVDVIL